MLVSDTQQHKWVIIIQIDRYNIYICIDICLVGSRTYQYAWFYICIGIIYISIPSLWASLPHPIPHLWVITEHQAGLPVLYSSFPLVICLTLEKEWATQFSILAWRIPWTEEPGRLQSMGSQRVGHDWVTNTCTHLFHTWHCIYIHQSHFCNSSFPLLPLRT